MTDLLDTPLSGEEIGALPDSLRWHPWAGEIGEGVPGLTEIKRQAARHEARAWLLWARSLKPGQRARYVGIATALRGRPVEINEVRVELEPFGSRFVSIKLPEFGDRFIVDPTDLRPA